MNAASPTRLAALVTCRILVVGEAPWVESAAGGVPVTRARPDQVDRLSGPIAVAVLDATTHAVLTLTRVRTSERLAEVPILLVTDDDGEASIDMLRPDDIVSPRCSLRELARRLRVLYELGSARLSLTFADQALQHSVNGLAIADTHEIDSPIVGVTHVFEQLTGYSPREVLGRNCRFLQGDETDPVAVTALRTAAKEGTVTTVVLRNYRKDGTAFWNEVTLFPIAYQGESKRWIGGVQHDVTDLVDARAEVERLLRVLVEHRTFAHAILDGVDVGIVTTDGAGRITFLNRCARESLGLDTDHAGDDVCELLGLEATPEALLGHESRRRMSCTLLAPNGTELDVELSVSRAEDAAHERVGFFLIFRDLTEEKLMESERRRFQHLAAMGTMVAGFAHEVRNPVASLRSLAEALNEELAEAKLPLPHVGRMLKVLERVERLVSTSLQFGRPATPKRALHKPWSILSATVSALVPRTRELGGEIRVEIEPDLPEVYVDDAQLVQVLVVFLNNALDATGSPRRVLLRAAMARTEVEARPRKSQPPPGAPTVRFEVTDDGPGIPASIRDCIFDPFFTTKPTGTGLGLSIAQQLVSENGGRLDVASAPGGPTTFAVLLGMEAPRRPMR